MSLSKRWMKDLIWVASIKARLDTQMYSLTIGDARQILDALKIKYTIPKK